MTEEHLLTDNSCSSGPGWRAEAAAVIQDLRDHVNEIRVSDQLKSDRFSIYLNLQTKESDKMTVEMSSAGFRICGHSYDSLSDMQSKQQPQQYETMNALLNETSPGFRQSFASALHHKLSSLIPSEQSSDSRRPHEDDDS
jgi:hypothetical protein